MPDNDHVSPPTPVSEYAIVAAGVSIIAIGVVTWLGARLAVIFTGGSVSGGLGEWLIAAARLAQGRPPSVAWGDRAVGLPGSVLYWTCTGIVLTAAIAMAVSGAIVWRRWVPRRGRRVRFGQDTDARQARPRDVAPLIIDSIVPPTGRMLLGRMTDGGPLLATEDRERHPLQGRAARRQGHRGSVALVGPTGSGKTALATAAIATWDGPVVAVSVKRDLYDTTITARARKGDIAVFDPGGATGLPTARWSPLQATTTSTGALRTGRALGQAIPKGGVTNADYWAEHGEALLGAFMSVAGLSRVLDRADGTPLPHVGMRQLAAWVRTLAGAAEPTINNLLRRALDDIQPLETRLLAEHAAITFDGIDNADHKIRSSVYSTAVLALKPWLEPAVAHSATNNPHHHYNTDNTHKHLPRYVDLDWLMAGPPNNANTLYLAAPSAEFERLSPVLGGLLAELKDTIHAWDIAGRPLDKPLLIVIDEAAQLQLNWLPTEVSTIAALGAFFVTCWQNLAQINHRHDTLADAVLSGHRTKCFFAGIDDPATTRYLTNLLGHEHVTRYTASRDLPPMWSTHQHGRRTINESTQREEFAPAHSIRQMYPGQAILLHGTLPPVHLDAIRWWTEPDLHDLMPNDLTVSTVVAAGIATCPLTNRPTPAQRSEESDSTALRDAKERLPPPSRRRPPEYQSGETERTDHADQEEEPPSASKGQTHRQCAICMRPLDEGEACWRNGQWRCAPSCSARNRQ